MKVYIYGNSLVRSIHLEEVEDMVILPGGTCFQLVMEAFKNPHVRNCLLYIIEGPIRYTKIVSTNRRREMLPRTIVPNISKEYEFLSNACKERGIHVVFPTMSALHFSTYNKCIANRNGLRMTMRAFYSEYQQEFCRKIVIENGIIVGHNRAWKLHTPFLNKGTIISGRKFSYGRHKLYDGLHPHYRLRRTWARELRKNISLNLARLGTDDRAF